MVLDAGSTGTRVHVFQYAADSSSSYAALKLPEPKLKAQPGLSAYADNAAGAAASLQPLLQYAAQHIPASQIPSTPVYLMATAGLRLLPTAAADSILMECRTALLASDFMFESEWAQIITGTYEGLYAWVAANYAAGHLQVSMGSSVHTSRSDSFFVVRSACDKGENYELVTEICTHTAKSGAHSLYKHMQEGCQLVNCWCLLLLQAAAEDAAHSRKDLHAAQPGFKALLEMGGASAQVTFMPDAHWHKHSTGSSKQRVRLKLPGAGSSTGPCLRHVPFHLACHAVSSSRLVPRPQSQLTTMICLLHACMLVCRCQPPPLVPQLPGIWF